MSGSLLEALVEEELGSVVFVMDYVQLDFGAARFSAYVWPTVTIGDAPSSFGDHGYRDALCAFITHEVLSTDESPEAGLVIRFGLGEIVINRVPTDLGGPEIAQLQVHPDSLRDEAWVVWRPGEGIFASRHWSGRQRPHLGTVEFTIRDMSARLSVVVAAPGDQHRLEVAPVFILRMLREHRSPQRQEQIWGGH